MVLWNTLLSGLRTQLHVCFWWCWKERVLGRRRLLKLNAVSQKTRIMRHYSKELASLAI